MELAGLLVDEFDREFCWGIGPEIHQQVWGFVEVDFDMAQFCERRAAVGAAPAAHQSCRVGFADDREQVFIVESGAVHPVGQHEFRAGLGQHIDFAGPRRIGGFISGDLFFELFAVQPAFRLRDRQYFAVFQFRRNDVFLKTGIAAFLVGESARFAVKIIVQFQLGIGQYPASQSGTAVFNGNEVREFRTVEHAVSQIAGVGGNLAVPDHDELGNAGRPGIFPEIVNGRESAAFRTEAAAGRQQ